MQVPRRIRLALALPVLLVLGGAAAFTANGLASREGTPVLGVVAVEGRGAAGSVGDGDELVVAAWNLAVARAHRGLSFDSAENVRERLAAMAEVVRAEGVDVLFLSEVALELGPVPVDQVRELARRTGLPHFAFGEEKSFGLPFFRLRSGNAVLSRFPLEDAENVQLAGEKPFWDPTNNRRILLCDLVLGEERLRVGAVRNDSFDLENNARQVRQILERLGEGTALLAGDFNAEPADESLELLRASGKFEGTFDGPPTWPSGSPRRRIDYVLAPRGFRVVEERVVDTRLSDHRPVVARLARPGR